MRFVFSRRFFILLAIGFIPLSLSWNLPWLRTAVFVYDGLLVLLAFVDYFVSRKLPEELTVEREFGRRFAIGDQNEVHLKIENRSPQTFHLRIKDEFPPEMRLSEKREAVFTIEGQRSAEFSYILMPPRRGRYQFGRTAVRFFSRLGLVWCQDYLNKVETVKVYPNMRRRVKWN